MCFFLFYLDYCYFPLYNEAKKDSNLMFKEQMILELSYEVVIREAITVEVKLEENRR